MLVGGDLLSKASASNSVRVLAVLNNIDSPKLWSGESPAGFIGKLLVGISSARLL